MAQTAPLKGKIAGARPSSLTPLGQGRSSSFMVEPDVVEARIRAGMLEPGSVAALIDAGVGEHLQARGIAHDGFCIAHNNALHRINIREATGCAVTVYGQTEVTRDLMNLRTRASDQVLFEVEALAIDANDAAGVRVSFIHEGQSRTLACDYIAGCDGAHGVSRETIPPDQVRTFEFSAPAQWLGLMADVPPVHEELIYASHPRGFALCSMRSHSRSRYYLQVGEHEDANAWSADQFWEELNQRLPMDVAPGLQTGAALEMSTTPLRSVVIEPMQYGRLYLAGDAAHTVPPTGAKGLNLAIADVRLLAERLIEACRTGSDSALGTYAEDALARVWQAVRFSWQMTRLLHTVETDPASDRLRQLDLEHLLAAPEARTLIARNYAGVF